MAEYSPACEHTKYPPLFTTEHTDTRKNENEVAEVKTLPIGQFDLVLFCFQLKLIIILISICNATKQYNLLV